MWSSCSTLVTFKGAGDVPPYMLVLGRHTFQKQMKSFLDGDKHYEGNKQSNVTGTGDDFWWNGQERLF